MVFWIESRRQIGFAGRINDAMLSEFLKLYQIHDAPGEPLELLIVSEDGSTGIMDVMLTFIAASQKAGSVVRVIAAGYAESCAVQLLAAGTKGERYILGKDSNVMLHEVRRALNGEVPVTAYQALGKLLEETQADYYDHLGRTTKHKSKWWRKLLRDRNDVFLTAEEAVSYGIADHVVKAMPPVLKTTDPKG